MRKNLGFPYRKANPGTSKMPSQFKSLRRAIDILILLGERASLTAPEISDLLKLPLSTTYKYLAVMREYRMVDYEQNLERYSPGMKLFELGSAVQNRFEINKLAYPYMQELSNQLEETVALNVIDGNMAINLEYVKPENRELFVLSLRKGIGHPLHAGAAGKILLAYQPEDRIERYLKTQKLVKYTNKTSVDPDELRKQLKAIRKVGYALSTEEIHLGFSAFAAPIFDHEGKIIAGLHVFGPMERTGTPKKEKIIELIGKYAKKISERITGKLS
jgi:DNA-binding IclR family transcriptional regulator